MKFTTVIALAGLLASSPSWSAGGDAAAGQAKSAVCVACHSVDGNSVDPLYPKIAGQHAEYIARQLTLFKSGKRQNPIMLGIAMTLSDQDMLDLGAHFAAQTVKPDIADEALVPLAQGLYRIGDAKRGIPACMSCHGPTGRGNPAARYPAIASQHGRYTADMLRRFRGGEIHGDAVDVNGNLMPQIAAKLSDAEIEALASYIQGLSSATP